MQKPSAAPRCSLAQEGGCLLFLNVFLLSGRPRWLWSLPCRLLFCLKGEILLWLGSKHSSPVVGSVTHQCHQSCVPAACAEPQSGLATRGHARQPMTTAPAILNPLFITRMCFLPKIQSRSAACLLILTQVPPVSQVWSCLTTWPVGSGIP